jgi:flagellar basal-body rod modification protein FlgD
MSTGTAVGTNASALKSASSLQTAAASATTKVEQDRKTIASNFDSFLSLLTTQLKNQNPLEPLDANQFTQQLVQFSGVEQQLKSNDLLTTISKNLGGGSSAGKLGAAGAASLIGVQVSADAATNRLTSDGKGGYSAQYPVQIQANYKNYQVEIKNSKGETVFQGPWAPTGTGEQAYLWNGRNSSGAPVDAEDKYTISVVGELASGGKSLMSTLRSGTVTAVDLSGTEEMVQFGGYSLPLSQIKRVAKVGS